MAKRKLSAEQRTKLRAELADGVKAGTKTPELLEAVSKKYGITTITARWYLKSIDGAPKRRTGKGGRPPKNGQAALHTEALEAFERAKKAKSLVPRWQKLVDQKTELERQSKKIDRQLIRVTKKAEKLGKIISSLVS